MLNPKLNIMKTTLKTLFLLPFFALLMFTSCQDEVTEITEPNEAEALVADSNLTAMVSAASKMDGSRDNIIDKANCLAIKLPVVVIVNDLEIRVDSEEDFKTIEAIFDEFEEDDDRLDIIFPITIINENHDEITINNAEELRVLVEKCRGENEEDDDIECIDFKYPISFTVYNPNFQVIDVIPVENDRELHRFIKRVIEAEVLASLNFPVTMVLADGSEVTVQNNIQLERVIAEAKDACDEDDDNDYNDDDFTKERLDEYLKRCPWLVNEFKRDAVALTDRYFDYAINFKEDDVVVMRARNGDVLTGTWSTRVSDRGALIKMEFDNLADFTLEWFVYEIEEGRIKIYQEGGNRILLKRNCDIVIEHTKERVENFLKECLWRVARLNVDGADNEKDYIGTPLKFYENNVVKIRINGELVEGTYEVLVRNAGIGLEIFLEGRPDLKLQWLITFLGEDLIKLENNNNQMVLKRHCPQVDGDLNEFDDILITRAWEVASYMELDADLTEIYFGFTFDFIENGRIKVYNPNEVVVGDGSWLSYRDEGLFLGMHFGPEQPFVQINHRWKIVSFSENRIELKDYNANGGIERILVLEKKA